MNTSSCDHCEGYYEFEIEGPDYEVGLMGYSVFLNNTTFDTHDDDCPVRTMNQEDIEKIEYKLSIMAAERQFDPEPLVDIDY